VNRSERCSLGIFAKVVPFLFFVAVQDNAGISPKATVRVVTCRTFDMIEIVRTDVVGIVRLTVEWNEFVSVFPIV
jgi:hypothetical protein